MLKFKSYSDNRHSIVIDNSPEASPLYRDIASFFAGNKNSYGMLSYSYVGDGIAVDYTCTPASNHIIISKMENFEYGLKRQLAGKKSHVEPLRDEIRLMYRKNKSLADIGRRFDMPIASVKRCLEDLLEPA